jgi:hypothetical protein
MDTKFGDVSASPRFSTMQSGDVEGSLFQQ